MKDLMRIINTIKDFDVWEIEKMCNKYKYNEELKAANKSKRTRRKKEEIDGD